MSDRQLRLTDEYLFAWFGLPSSNRQDQESFAYAITPYVSREEYVRDQRLLAEYNTSASPQTRFLIVQAAKVERTEREVMGLRP